MKRIRKAHQLIDAIFSMYGMFAIVPLASATTYYVDSTSGCDTANGTSPATAWQTLAKVDATTFTPGDHILFARGDSWVGQLHPLGSGSASDPITVDAYGTGALPVIAGESLISGATVYLINQQYWVIQDLEITNNSGADNFGSVNPNSPGASRDGVLVEDNGGGILTGITINNNDVHDVNGCFFCWDIDAHINGGIVVYAAGSGDSFANVAITGNNVHDLGRTGIVFWDASYYSSSPSTIDQTQLSTGLIIDGNTVTNVDSDGVLSFGAEGAVLQRNIVGNAGQKTLAGSTEPSAAGLWPTRSMDTTVQYNEVYGTLTQGTDGQGFDVDLYNINTKVQYNYSHDNQGGFLLMMGGSSSSNLVVRNNLSVNDAYGGVKGVFTFSWGLVENTAIYNNTVYIPSGTAEQPIFCDSCQGSAPGTWSFNNNIVENLGSGGYLYPSSTGSNPIFNSNVFYGNHPSSEPPDANKLTSDPQLVAPGPSPLGINSVNGYQIALTSPAAGSSTLISENGSLDYFGRKLTATMAPSRGFYEVQKIAGQAQLVDNANDWMVTAAHTANMILDTSSPNNMNGDSSRYSRANSSPGSLVWNFNGMQSFSANIYEFYANLTTLTFSTSPDGISWAPLLITHGPLMPTKNGWAATTYKPIASLPSGTQYLKATIAAPIPWAIEIGAITIEN